MEFRSRQHLCHAPLSHDFSRGMWYLSHSPARSATTPGCAPLCLCRLQCQRHDQWRQYTVHQHKRNGQESGVSDRHGKRLLLRCECGFHRRRDRYYEDNRSLYQRFQRRSVSCEQSRHDSEVVCCFTQSSIRKRGARLRSFFWHRSQ